MEKCFGQKIVLTGCKNPEKMLLNNDHKLITPLLNNLDKTHTAFNIGIQQQYAIIALLRVSDTVRPKNIDLAPPDYRIHPLVRVDECCGRLNAALHIEVILKIYSLTAQQYLWGLSR
ncbi:hypothetical protein PV325_009337 [Microctonus aethiopoides]|nr:hypothetical protein PV325_009337 [Microctonus aethiopoides]